MGKTKIKEVGYPDEFKELITLNDDIDIDDTLKNKIINTEEDKLLQVVKVIGSTPIKIESVDVYDERFLLDNF